MNRQPSPLPGQPERQPERAPEQAGVPSGGAPQAAGDAGPSFEVAIKRLGEIVQALERGDLPLEESLRLFEEGVALSRTSQQKLDLAEKRVEQLLAVDSQGNARTSRFDFEADDEDDGSPRKAADAP
jgi:exodeoxyribonuclease VII small subunit